MKSIRVIATLAAATFCLMASSAYASGPTLTAEGTVLKWTAVSKATQYRIALNPVSPEKCEIEVCFIHDTTELSSDEAGIADGWTYSFKVREQKPKVGEWSNAVEIHFPVTFGGFTATNQPPAGYQPYEAGSVFNIKTAFAKPILNSQAMVDYSLTLGTPSPGNATEQPGDKHPVYYASSSDPEYKVKLEPPEEWGSNPIQGIVIRIPKYAIGSEGGSDHHMAVIEPNGTEYDFWKVISKVDGSPGTLTASWGGVGSYTGPANGTSPASGATAGGFLLGAGLVRYPEIAAATAGSFETINHGLFVVIKNGRGPKGAYIAPAIHGDGVTEGEEVPYQGQRFALMNTAGTAPMSNAEIEAVTSKPWQRAVLSAFARYGAIDGDGGNSGFQWMQESATMYTAAGLANPWKTYGEEHSLPIYEGHYVYKLIEGSLTLTWWKEHLKAISVPE